MRRCEICLQAPPEISAIGIPRHGEASLVDDYLLPDHWCFHIYSYHGILELDGVSFPIGPGSASIIPPGTRMVYRYSGPSEHVYFHFLNRNVGPKVDIDLIFELRDHFAPMDRRARLAVGRARSDTGFPTAMLWSLLCEVVDLQQNRVGQSNLHGHPAVDLAIRHIEQRLSKPLAVAQLCDEVGVSNGYLSRLFQEYLGQSVLEYVRSRRADQAEHLIRSTTLPIKAIARSVGVPDLQQFNRLMHALKGKSPREIRAQHLRSLG